MTDKEGRLIARTRVDTNRNRYRFKADKPQETTEEVEFKKQQAMQEHLKQMTRRAGVGVCVGLLYLLT